MRQRCLVVVVMNMPIVGCSSINALKQKKTQPAALPHWRPAKSPSRRPRPGACGSGPPAGARQVKTDLTPRDQAGGGRRRSARLAPVDGGGWRNHPGAGALPPEAL